MSFLLVAQRALTVPGWAKNALWRAAKATPSLDLPFADSKSLVDAVTGASLITFTRASSATYVGSDGLIKTATTNEPRFNHNPTTGESLGLLVEEQRTNLVTSSATFQPSSGGNPASYTVDQVAPDGTTTASRQTAANPRTFVDYTGIANAQYTFSVYAKATSGTITISLQLKNAATDTVITAGSNVTLTTAWQRLTVTGTTNGAITGTRIEVFGVSPGTVFWGAQLEAGAFPTSYIPTTTATATRSADVASITGTNFSSWFNQTQGTTYTSAQVGYTVPGSYFPVVAAMNDGTSANRLEFGYLTATLAGFGVVLGGVDQGSVYPLTTAVVRNLGCAYQSSNGAASVNGGGVLTLGSMGVPAVNQLTLGRAPAAGNVINGTIRRLTYWPARLANSTLQAITQ